MPLLLVVWLSICLTCFLQSRGQSVAGSSLGVFSVACSRDHAGKFASQLNGLRTGIWFWLNRLCRRQTVSSCTAYESIISRVMKQTGLSYLARWSPWHMRAHARARAHTHTQISGLLSSSKGKLTVTANCIWDTWVVLKIRGTLFLPGF